MIHTKFDIGDKVVVLETGKVCDIERIIINVWKGGHNISYGLNTALNSVPENKVGTPQDWYDYTTAKLCKMATEAVKEFSVLMKAVK